MLKVRRMLEGEERIYNGAYRVYYETGGRTEFYTKKKSDGGNWIWIATITAEGLLVENVAPCAINHVDGSRAAMKQALEDVQEARGVREARSIARRTLREAGE